MIVTAQALVMVFGALLALAGLLLLVFRKDHGQNKIRVLGQEFEISTPALVVFLAGCVIFVIPFWTSADLSKPIIVLGSRSSSGLSGIVAAVGGEEKEPNDQFTQANVVRFGVRVRGRLTTSTDRDFFKFKTPGPVNFKGRVILRKLSLEGFFASVTLYGAAEGRVAAASATSHDSATFAFDADPDADYYILVKGSETQRGEYELEVRKDNQ
jgi:hypothetical protein